MIYVYEHLDDGEGTGEYFEHEQPFGEDALSEIEGFPVHRVPQPGVGVVVKRGFVPYKSTQLADWEPSAKHHTKDGRPVFKRAADERECVDRVNDDVFNPIKLVKN